MNIHPVSAKVLGMLLLVFGAGCSSKIDSGAVQAPIKSMNKTSIGKKLRENDQLPIAERIALYYRLRREHPESYTFESEDDLTMYGYSLLWSGKTSEAIEIFRLLVREFPESYNVYDNLGEGLLQNGDQDSALYYYEKSLVLNPENYNAITQIKRIRQPESSAEFPAGFDPELFSKTYPAEAYRQDLEELGKALVRIHPNALKFISGEKFWQLIGEKQNQVTDQTTYAEFFWMCDEIIASIGCSHTSTGGFYFETQMLPVHLRFPVEVRWIDEHLYVVDDSGNAGSVAVGDEIVHINDVSVKDLMASIYRHIPAQGLIETSKRYVFNDHATLMIPYALGFPSGYTIGTSNSAPKVVLHQAEHVPDYQEPFQRPCPENLCLQFLNQDKTAILSVASFNYYWWHNLNEFNQFIDQSFKAIESRPVDHLIIDVRFNHGGSQHSSINLLKYLVDKPFTYYSESLYNEEEGLQTPAEHPYRGHLFFLIDGIGNSTTGHFMSIVKELNLGTIIGEELGSNGFCTAGQTTCRLPRTGLEYYVANSTAISSARSLPADRGILPDYTVKQDIDDYLQGRDVVMAFALQLINSQ